MCGAAGGTLGTRSGLSGRCGVRRCRGQPDLPAGCAAAPALLASPSCRPAHSDPRGARPRCLFVPGIARRRSAAADLLFPAAATCAAMAGAERRCAQALQLCLLLGQRLCTCRRLSVLRGHCPAASPALGSAAPLRSALPGLLRRGPRTVPCWACFVPGQRCSPQRRLRSAWSCWMVAPVE